MLQPAVRTAAAPAPAPAAGGAGRLPVAEPASAPAAVTLSLTVDFIRLQLLAPVQLTQAGCTAAELYTRDQMQLLVRVL